MNESLSDLEHEGGVVNRIYIFGRTNSIRLVLAQSAYNFDPVFSIVLDQTVLWSTVGENLVSPNCIPSIPTVQKNAKTGGNLTGGNFCN